jgi:Zinc finger, C2H2 type
LILRFFLQLKRKTGGVKVKIPSKEGMRMVVQLKRIQFSDAIRSESFDLKVEPDTESENPSANFCRCCFKSMNSIETQFRANATSLQAFGEVTQLQTVPYQVAPTFCEECFTTIQTFVEFKKLAVKRHQRFEATIEQDQNFLSQEKLFDPLKEELLENSSPLAIKDEPLDQDIFEPLFLPSHQFVQDFEAPVSDKYKATQNRFRQEKISKPKKTSKRTFKCKSCGFSTMNQYTLKAHMTKMHLTSETCQLCGEILVNKDELLQHWEKFHCENVLRTCDLCDFKSNFKGGIQSHMQNRHIKRSIKCKFCEVQAGNLHWLQVHMKRMHPTSQMCQVCGEVLGNYSQLLEHSAKSHSENIRRTCDLCGYSGLIKNQMTKHMQNRHFTQTIPCVQCDFKTNSLYKLRLHISRKHTLTAPKLKIVSCFICKQKVKAPYLKTHIARIHKKVKRYPCKYCDKEFYGSTGLR